VIDSAGGGAEFTAAAQAELAAIFPDAARQLEDKLAANHAVYAAGGGKPLTEIRYRNFAKLNLVGSMSAPRLRGIDIAGRTAILFSPEDLTVASSAPQWTASTAMRRRRPPTW